MNRLPFEKKELKTYVKIKDAVSSPEYGKAPEERTTEELLESGIVVIDKPAGPSSHQVSAYVKKILMVEKTGHSGTLDPAVTGVLPVALGRATRVLGSLLSAGKEYVCLMHIHANVSDDELVEVFKRFTGRIKQLPPVKSAIKRRERYRTIYYMELIERKDNDVLFRVGCQAGTYIRKLVHDMGLYLKVGAHMAELRRTKAGPFKEGDSVTLNELVDEKYYFDKKEEKIKSILPMERGIAHIPKVWVLDSAVFPLCNGVSLKMPGIAKLQSPIKKGDAVAVLTLKGELIMIGESMMSCKDMKRAEKGIAVKPLQVIMRQGIYPKINNKNKNI